MPRSLTGRHCALDGGLKIFPADVTQLLLQITRKPELDTFSISALCCCLKMSVQNLQLLIYVMPLIS
jgi:hypothetical protein